MSYKVIKTTSHQQWLDERKKGVGSSEAGTIMGVNHFDTPLLVTRSFDYLVTHDCILLAAFFPERVRRRSRCSSVIVYLALSLAERFSMESF